MATNRPNIIYIFTDQQSANAMSCAGNKYLNTPAMDRLAENGLRFETAYTSFPLCVPARMSMFTGRMPHELGIFANVDPSEQPCQAPMLGKRLADNGYLCHYVGKWHLTVPEERVDEHGFNQIVLGGGYGGLDSAKADAAVEFLESNTQTPFFMPISFLNPHDCCQLARGQKMWMESLPPEPPAKDLPPAPDNLESGADEPEVLREFQHEYPKLGCAKDWNEHQIRRFRWGYNRLVEIVDKEIGKVLDALERSGQWDNTLIIFASDHGDGQGAHYWNQKWCLYDESSRVPFIISAPGQQRKGQVEHSPVSATLDLLPTCCDYAQVPIPENVQGQSVRPLLEDEREENPREFVVSETSFGNWGELFEDRWPKARMVRSKRYKYIAYDTGENREQFFDMETDPSEINNLVNNPLYTEELNRHRNYLRQWTIRTKDNTFNPPIA